MEFWGVFIIAGLLAGFFAGLLGIGGGFVVVPVLIFALPKAGIASEQAAHFAIGTSLLCICITALASTRGHHQRSAVDWSVFRITAPGLIIGSLAGAALAALVSGLWLTLLFVGGALVTAIYLISGHRPQPTTHKARWPLFVYGQFTGLVSALIGIGGGSVLVPFFVYRGKSMVQSVGTAAACGFPIALFGALGYAISGINRGVQIDYATGYLYWPAFFGIVIFSTLSAPLGVKLAHFIPEKHLRRVFALFLFFTSGQILYSQWL